MNLAKYPSKQTVFHSFNISTLYQSYLHKTIFQAFTSTCVQGMSPSVSLLPNTINSSFTCHPFVFLAQPMWNVTHYVETPWQEKPNMPMNQQSIACKEPYDSLQKNQIDNCWQWVTGLAPKSINLWHHCKVYMNCDELKLQGRANCGH
jgi:hypothetical protein